MVAYLPAEYREAKAECGLAGIMVFMFERQELVARY
jgi:hypothetical protein